LLGNGGKYAKFVKKTLNNVLNLR